jgi:hypothetical protein
MQVVSIKPFLPVSATNATPVPSETQDDTLPLGFESSDLPPASSPSYPWPGRVLATLPYKDKNGGMRMKMMKKKKKKKKKSWKEQEGED